MGQNLTLLGGTVINTGTLTAPGGQITVASVPNSNLVRITQPGMLLGLEIQPLASLSSPSSSLPSLLSLPQLLTGGNLQNATGLTVTANGDVVLSSSGQVIEANAGTITISGHVDATSATGIGETLVGNPW